MMRGQTISNWIEAYAGHDAPLQCMDAAGRTACHGAHVHPAIVDVLAGLDTFGDNHAALRARCAAAAKSDERELLGAPDNFPAGPGSI